MNFMQLARITKEMTDIMDAMKEAKKYIKFGKHNDFVILDDDFTLEQLEAIIFTMKGKQCG